MVSISTKSWRGIVEAAGGGPRFHHMTVALYKPLFPVYEKPMIYYPLSTLILAGIREILLISTPQHTPLFCSLLGNGRQWGIDLDYAVEPSPGGLPQPFLIGTAFIGTRPSCLMPAETIVYRDSLSH